MEGPWQRVKANGGSAGVDGRSVEATAAYLREHWPRLERELLDGAYRELYGRLKLRINEAKSAVAPATARPLLGFGFRLPAGVVKRQVADTALVTYK